MSAPQAKSKTRANSDVDPIFEAIAVGLLSSRLADSDELQITAATIAEWKSNPGNQEKMQNLITVFEWQSQLVAAQGRSRSNFALLEVRHDPNSKPETIRKAATEILKISFDPGRRRPSRSTTPPPHITEGAGAATSSTRPAPSGSRNSSSAAPASSACAAPPSNLALPTNAADIVTLLSKNVKCSTAVGSNKPAPSTSLSSASESSAPAPVPAFRAPLVRLAHAHPLASTIQTA